MKNKLILASLVTVSTLYGSDFCNYHPYDTELCGVSIYTTGQTKVVNRTFSITVVDKQIEKIIFTEVEEIGEDEETSNSKTKKQHNISINNTFSDDANSYSVPYSYSFNDSYGMNISATLVDNKVTKKQGIGDSSIGLNYNFNAFSIELSALIPTGNEEDGLGLGALGVIASLDYRNQVTDSTYLLFSTSYTYIDESDDSKIDYGDTLTGLVGIKQYIFSNTAIRSKLSYISTSENVIDGTTQDDTITLIDAIVGLDINIIYGLELNIGALFPISDEYGDDIGGLETRTNVYYFTVNKDF